MSLTSITLHRAAADNAGDFQDAGAELKISDKAEAGAISAERARDLLDSHGATGHYARKVAAQKTGGAASGTSKSAPAPDAAEPSASTPAAD
jgi:topoisomerase IA-like protein